MNAIEALKQNGYVAIELEGDKAFYNSIDLIWDINKRQVSMKYIMKEGWKIYQEKKKIIIEDVEWYMVGNGVYPTSVEKDINFWKLLINKSKMKMTLEWKE